MSATSSSFGGVEKPRTHRTAPLPLPPPQASNTDVLRLAASQVKRNGGRAPKCPRKIGCIASVFPLNASAVGTGKSAYAGKRSAAILAAPLLAGSGRYASELSACLGDGNFFAPRRAAPVIARNCGSLLPPVESSRNLCSLLILTGGDGRCLWAKSRTSKTPSADEEQTAE
jgi:hypothetical protein